ncbi:hypothetical protein GPECTOR_710g862 [Gonium pectorale]|uniref:SET domain-containing protein n=1 Tax=Gonium pectorale TaxID=33097 RepID=A0A150FU87_GONPE|nr:hypothetical protein GPECTOR_710g862 [Gonium pectorale]|eukprot:KXZ41159.1 hypothetical protein GPECTOR_710g862 [Gonium pectorale]
MARGPVQTSAPPFPPCRVSGLGFRSKGRLVPVHAAAAASSPGSGPGGRPPPPPLEEWLRSNGGTVNGVALRSTLYPSGAIDRQLVASTDHPAGALLLSVPRRLQIRYDNVEEAAAASSSTSSSASTHSATGGSGDAEADAAAPYGLPAADAAAVASLFARLPVGSDTGAPAWQLRQALTLLAHLAAGPASALAPYLAHLPGLAHGVPTPRVAMLMYDDAVDELQYGSLVHDVRNQKYWLARVAREVLAGGGGGGRELPSPAGEERTARSGGGGGSGEGSGRAGAPFRGLAVDEGLLGWAVAVAMSRCFGLSRSRAHTCVPLIDMANHVAPHGASNAEIRSGPGGEVAMYAKRQIKAGEELTLTYGSHDNANLLLSYGFTLQPNPYDAFYFVLDLETLESLVEGMGDGSTQGGLAEWQLRLLRDKLGLRPLPGPGQEGKPAAEDGASGSIRVFLSAADPPVAAGQRGSAAGGDGEEQQQEGSGPAVLAQPVDPKLLAALRIATLQDEAWYGQLAGRSVERIGGWGNLLARQQEISVMRLLAALVTALYTSFPTTIQQDRKLLASASIDVAAAAAASTLTSGTLAQPITAAAAAAAAPSPVAPSASSTGGWPLRPHDPPAGSGGADPSAAATAAHTRDAAEAVRFRLGLKLTLERCLQSLVARAKQLDELQKVR